MEGRIIDHEDGMVTSVHTLTPKYVAHLFNTMYERRTGESGNIATDKLSMVYHGLKFVGEKMVAAAPHVKNALKRFYGGVKARTPTAKEKASHAKLNAKTKAKGTSRWAGTFKNRFLFAIIGGFLLILFSNYILYALRYLFSFLGWVIP
jgi:hypothetical protein